jgi:hypothetical protein
MNLNLKKTFLQTVFFNINLDVIKIFYLLKLFKLMQKLI